MERLTERGIDGNVFYPRCISKCNGVGSSSDCDDCEMEDAIHDTLAAYEDTGLTPEEINELQEKYEALLDGANNAYGLYREYKDAEEQGLLIKLPCMVGDTVYWVNSYHDETGRKKINSVQVQCYTWWLTHGFCVKIANLYEEIPCIDKAITEFGKTLFLTREAAEEALKGDSL